MTTITPTRVKKRKKKCGCWDCRRACGETPRMPKGKVKTTEDNRIQRTIGLYAGCSVNEKIPPDSDLTGADRPGYGAKRTRRR